MGENAILVDYDVSDKWDYKAAIEAQTNEEWKIEKCITNRYHGTKIKNIFRFILYFLFSFKIFLKKNKYDKVIAWQQFYGLILAFYCAVFHVKRAPQIFVMSFIFKPKKFHIYNEFVKFILKSGYIKKCIVLSDSEKEHYSRVLGVSSNMFYCSRIGVSDIAENIITTNNVEKNYISVGRSNRDYVFLRDVWSESYGKLIIISDSYNLPPKAGITCLKNCHGHEYLQMVADCYAQIISLDDVNIASGSLSFLQAMMLSKPTIVTENATVHDYIVSGENGIIIEKTSENLEWAIEYLNDERNYKRVCGSARTSYEKKFSQYAIGLDIGKMILDIDKSES